MSTYIKGQVLERNKAGRIIAGEDLIYARQGYSWRLAHQINPLSPVFRQSVSEGQLLRQEVTIDPFLRINLVEGHVLRLRSPLPGFRKPRFVKGTKPFSRRDRIVDKR